MKKIINVITLAQLIEMFMNWNKGAQPATIQYENLPRMNAEGKATYEGVFKLGAVNCMIDYNFEKAVNRRLIKEGKTADFVAKPLWNGYGDVLNRRVVQRRVTKTSQKNGVKSKVETGEVITYLRFKFQKQLKSLYFDNALNFIPVALLKPYFPAYNAPANQGVNDGAEILPRTMKFENIRKIKMLGATYVIQG